MYPIFTSLSLFHYKHLDKSENDYEKGQGRCNINFDIPRHFDEKPFILKFIRLSSNVSDDIKFRKILFKII